MEPPTVRLRREHRLILQVIDVLDAIMASADPRALPLNDIDRCIAFFRLFTDACHHGQEEDVLFTALEKHGEDAMDGLIGVLRDEHREGRALVSEMREALGRLRSDDIAAEPDLRAVADEYSAMIRAHIHKEDVGLFDIADSLIDGPESDTLCAACDLVCRRRFEGHTLADLEGIATDLTARYGKR